MTGIIREDKREEGTAAGAQRKRLLSIGVLFVVWLALTVAQWRLFGQGAAGSVLEALGAFALVNVNILISNHDIFRQF